MTTKTITNAIGVPNSPLGFDVGTLLIVSSKAKYLTEQVRTTSFIEIRCSVNLLLNQDLYDRLNTKMLLLNKAEEKDILSQGILFISLSLVFNNNSHSRGYVVRHRKSVTIKFITRKGVFVVTT